MNVTIFLVVTAICLAFAVGYFLGLFFGQQRTWAKATAMIKDQFPVLKQ